MPICETLWEPIRKRGAVVVEVRLVFEGVFVPAAGEPVVGRRAAMVGSTAVKGLAVQTRETENAAADQIL